MKDDSVGVCQMFVEDAVMIKIYPLSERSTLIFVEAVAFQLSMWFDIRTTVTAWLGVGSSMKTTIPFTMVNCSEQVNAPVDIGIV